MKAVLLSIRPKWVELIASGKKTIEVRKTAPHAPTPLKVYMYMTRLPWLFDMLRTLGMHKMADVLTRGSGKVVGEFVCKRIATYEQLNSKNYLPFYYNVSPGGHFLYPVDDDQTQISDEELIDYGGGARLRGWHIGDLVIFDEPKNLSEFMRKPCDFAASCGACGHAKWLSGYRFDGCELTVTRPPQSWCYVEDQT